MKLDDLRKEINDIDGEMLQLFLKRMEICKSIALYKKENDLPIMQEGREQQVIDKVRAASPEHMADAAAVMFTEVMAYGFPYHECGKYLIGNVDYEGVIQAFYEFYRIILCIAIGGRERIFFFGNIRTYPQTHSRVIVSARILLRCKAANTE